MRKILLAVVSMAGFALVAGMAPACGSSSDNGNGDDGGSSGSSGASGSSGCTGFCSDSGGPPGCVGLACMQVGCDDPSVSTTLTGTVYDPAGKVPIFNAIVYVPQDNPPALPAITDGPSCDKCDAKIQNAVAVTSTDTSGNFTLKNVPVVDNLPLVIQIGKWRRVVQLMNKVQKCMSTPLDAASTRLPKNRMEGNIPRIALTTGAADPLQCLLHKVGVDDAEFGVAGSEARIHLYQGGGFAGSGNTPVLASSSIAGGAAFPTAESLWSDPNNLAKYDIVMLACEGGEDETTSGTCPTCTAGATKNDTAKTNMYAYAKAGGRVFSSHYHYTWWAKNPDAAVKATAQWQPGDNIPPGTFDGTLMKNTIDADFSTAFPKAVAMKDWLSKQSALTAGGQLHIVDPRYNVTAAASTALDWIHAQDTNGSPTPLNVSAIQQLSFDAPVDAAAGAACGRVVFSNLHVASGAQGGVQDDPQAAFPTGCKTTDLSPQQRALEFMLFDLSSCIETTQGGVDIPH